MGNRKLSGQRSIVLSLMCVMVSASLALAQQTTEKYIPIGYSPGMSGKYTYVGVIVAIDRDAHTISVEHDGVRKAIKVSSETRIWIDQSKGRRESLDGAYADCEVGRRVEVKYRGNDEGLADWIKIEAG